MADQNVNLTVTQSGGITHAILNKLHEDGLVAQGKNLSGSVWTQIMVEVKNDASGQYTGGSTFIEGQSSDAKASWASNFKVKAGQALEFTQALWNKIVAIVKGEPIEQEQSVSQGVPEETPEPVVQQEKVVSDPVVDTPVEPTPQEEHQQSVSDDGTIPQGVVETPILPVTESEGDGDLGQPLQTRIEQAPVIDQSPVYYDGDSGSVSPVPQGDDKSIPTDPVNVDGAEAPDKKTPSKLTQEQINEKINNLKNGESFSYADKMWYRNDDGTLTCNSPDYRGKPSITHYNNDGTVKLDSTTYEQFSGTSNYIKTSTVYKEGKISTKTQDLSGLGDIRSAHTVPSMLRTHMSRQQGAQDVSIKDSEGNNILSYKDGKFYNKKGKEVDSSKAYDILAKYEKRGELSQLVAKYQ